MSIEIESLSYEELIALNHKIVERLKIMESMFTHKEMMQFSPGDKVSFEPPGRSRQIGTLVKYNKKTVTVLTEDGHKWNVSPNLISKVKDVKSSKGKNNSGKVIELQKK